MAFSYEPMSQEDIDAGFQKLKEGVVKFKFVDAVEKPSSKGDPMLVLNIRVTDPDNKSAVYKEYIVPANNWKIANFLSALGKREDYDKPPFEWRNYQGQTGYCEIAYFESEYQGKKTLKLKLDFLKPEEAKGKMSDSMNPELNDDIQF